MFYMRNQETQTKVHKVAEICVNRIVALPVYPILIVGVTNFQTRVSLFQSVVSPRCACR